LKQKVSRSLRERKTFSGKQLRFAFSSEGDESPAFWQRRFYDFNVWSEKKLKEKLQGREGIDSDRCSKTKAGKIKTRTLNPEGCGTQIP